MKLKLIIIALVALLSAIFFWQTTNRFLYPSRATGPSIVTPIPGGAPSSTTAGGVGGAPGGSSTTNTTPSGGCALKAKGDFTCDGKIDISDFDLFRREYTGMLTTKESDGDGDGVVGLSDFDILRRGMFS